MITAIQMLADNAYMVLLDKLKRISKRQRDEERAGEFWANARMKVCGKDWVKGQMHWFENQEQVVPAALQMSASRYSYQTTPEQSFAPPTLVSSTLSQACEVA